MSGQHTPGPWTVDAVRSFGGDMVVRVNAGGRVSVDEAAANSVLIEAAPEMLSALKAAYVELANPGTTARNGEDMAAAILAVIAKAEGRS
jgi:hypothetical protein